MPPLSTSPAGQNISFGPKRVEKRQEQTTIEKLSLVLLAIALLATAAVYGYRFYLQGTLTRIQSEIAAAKTVGTTQENNALVAFDRKVRAARYLLANRLEPSRVFGALESSVSQSVFYQSFEAQLDEAGSLNLSLSGVSPEFAQIVLQNSRYTTASLLGQVTLAGIEIREGDTGRDTLFSVSARTPREMLLSSAPRTQARLPVAPAEAPTTTEPLSEQVPSTSSGQQPRQVPLNNHIICLETIVHSPSLDLSLFSAFS